MGQLVNFPGELKIIIVGNSLAKDPNRSDLPAYNL